jgi:hypothetical protein
MQNGGENWSKGSTSSGLPRSLAQAKQYHFFGFEVKVPLGPSSFTGTLPAFSTASHN